MYAEVTELGERFVSDLCGLSAKLLRRLEKAQQIKQEFPLAPQPAELQMHDLATAVRAKGPDINKSSPVLAYVKWLEIVIQGPISNAESRTLFRKLGLG